MAFNLRKFIKQGAPALDEYYQAKANDIVARIQLENAMWKRRFEVSEFQAKVQHQQAQEEYWNTQTEIAMAEAERKKNDGKFKDIKGGDGYYYLYNDKTSERISTGIKVPQNDGDGSAPERRKSRYLALFKKKKDNKLTDIEKEEYRILEQEMHLAMSPEEMAKWVASKATDPFVQKSAEELQKDVQHADSLSRGLIPSAPPDTTTAPAETPTGLIEGAYNKTKDIFGFGGKKTNAEKELEDEQLYEKFFGE